MINVAYTLIFAFVAVPYVQTASQVFECPKELSGPQERQFLRQTDPSRFALCEKAWKSTCDSNGRLSPELKDELWKEFVAFEIDRAIAENQTIDQFGLSVELGLYEKSEKLLERFALDLRKSLVGKTPSKAIESFLDKLKSTRKSMPDNDLVTAHLQLSRRRISAEKTELWLVVDLTSETKEFPIFVRNLHYKLARELGLRKMKRLEPHPESALTQKLILEDLRTPRKANRISAIDSLPPIPEDGLSTEQREDKHRFTVVDNVPETTHQIELISQGSTPDDDPKTQQVYDQELLRLSERLPSGKTADYEQLHKMFGEFSAKYRKYSKSNNVLVFAIEPYHHGKFTYAKIVVHCFRPEDFEK